jgi:hypothetical protein
MTVLVLGLLVVAAAVGAAVWVAASPVRLAAAGLCAAVAHPSAAAVLAAAFAVVVALASAVVVWRSMADTGWWLISPPTRRAVGVRHG